MNILLISEDRVKDRINKACEDNKRMPSKVVSNANLLDFLFELLDKEVGIINLEKLEDIAKTSTGIEVVNFIKERLPK